MKTANINLGSALPGPDLRSFLAGLRSQHPAFYFYHLMHQYGERVRIALGTLMFSHPEDIRHILLREGKLYSKRDVVSRRFRQVFGRNLMNMEGSRWAEQRRTVNPHFSSGAVQKYWTAWSEALAADLESWAEFASSGEEFDLLEESTKLLVLLSGKALLGIDLRDHLQEILVASKRGNEFLSNTSPLPIPLWLPFPRNGKLRQARKVVQNILKEYLRKRGPHQSGDNLGSTLIRQYQESSGKAEDRALLLNELMTMLLGGIFPLVAVLGMFWYALGQHPSCLDKLQLEIRRNGENWRPGQKIERIFPSLLPLLYESMRWHTTSYSLWRKAIRSDVVNGLRIPRGSTVCLSLFNMHRNPNFWRAPETFDPGRFYPESQKNIPAHYFIPFGYGPRKCIGDHYSMLLLPLLIIRILQRYTLTIPPAEALVCQKAPVLMPDSVMARIAFS